MLLRHVICGESILTKDLWFIYLQVWVFILSCAHEWVRENVGFELLLSYPPMPLS